MSDENLIVSIIVRDLTDNTRISKKRWLFFISEKEKYNNYRYSQE